MPELYTEVVYSQGFDAVGRSGQGGQSNSIFPNISPGMSLARQRQSDYSNADISMIDTSQLNNAHNVQRIVESHNATQVKKEVFVPSQINPRMKKHVGKSTAAEKRAQQLRGASAQSFGTNSATRSRVAERLRAYSLGGRN